MISNVKQKYVASVASKKAKLNQTLHLINSNLCDKSKIFSIAPLQSINYRVSHRKPLKQSFGGTKLVNGFEKSKHLVN